jgi:ABC-type glycerol-3-phosphate transport system substrate-binding protein
MKSNPAATLTALALAVGLAACATTKSEDVKIYSPAELKQGDYETVKRIWVESWRTAAWVPTYSSRDDGISALKDKAASVDANGLINVDCYGDSGLFGGSQAYTCYGKAIKVKGDPNEPKRILLNASSRH